MSESIGRTGGLSPAQSIEPAEDAEAPAQAAPETNAAAPSAPSSTRPPSTGFSVAALKSRMDLPTHTLTPPVHVEPPAPHAPPHAPGAPPAPVHAPGSNAPAPAHTPGPQAPGTHPPSAPSAGAPEGYALLDQARQAGHYLHKGASGPEVRALQEALNRAGAHLEVNGRLDAKTEAAVKAFQHAHHCSVDGIVGPQTMAALDQALGVHGGSTAPGGPSGAHGGHGHHGTHGHGGSGGSGGAPGSNAPPSFPSGTGPAEDPGSGGHGTTGPHGGHGGHGGVPAHGGSPTVPHVPPSGTPGVSGPSAPTGPLPHTGNDFIDSIAAGAVQSQRETGVPASVTLAQAILESGGGRGREHLSGLARNYHNLFGIKGSGPAGSINLPTHEVVNGQSVAVHANFRVYHNDAESLVDHARLLSTSHYYRNAMAHKDDPDAFARALTGVYATGTHYGDSLIAVMHQYNLYQFDHVR